MYRKQGAAVRYENGVVVHTVESGEAWFEDEAFYCRPSDGPRPPQAGSTAVMECAHTLLELVPAGIAVERLILTEGASAHSYGERTWEQRARRMHASFVAGRERMLIDAGDFRLERIVPLLTAFAAIEAERDAPELLVLEPRVSAALLGEIFAASLWRCEQRSGGRDGCGAPILSNVEPRAPWPNVWRPSYRVPPVRMVHNLAPVPSAECRTEGLSRAVALLSPTRADAVRLLVVDSAGARPCNLSLRPVRASAGPSEWYPFDAGSFGAEMVL